MDFLLIVPVFIAGLLTFLAPCTLPLVPGYLGFISGVSLEDIKDPLKIHAARRRIFLNGLLFMAGFSAVFIAMGTLVGFIGGTVLAPYRLWLGRIGGIFVIVFGLYMLNIFKWPAFFGRIQLRTFSFWERAVPNSSGAILARVFERGKPINSLILGSAFAFGWTPCVGPILGSVLFLASTSATALEGALLLMIFSSGLALPFLLIAAGIGSAASYIEKISKYLNAVSIVGGIFLIMLGVLLLTDNISFLISWGYQIFGFLEYDRLLDYL